MREVQLRYGAVLFTHKMLRGMHHYLSDVLACLLVASMAIVPTAVITFFAMAGGFWIARSF